MRSLATKIDVLPETVDAVEIVHRLPNREGKVPVIIAKFKSRLDRDKWFQKRNAMRQEGIYINENLTPQTKKLLWQTKEQARAKNYKFVWVRNGVVFVRKEQGSGAVRILEEGDLERLR